MKTDFFRAIIGLDVCGFIQGTQEVDRNVFIAGDTVGWRSAARELAAHLPGQIRPFTQGGLTWVNGADGPHGYLIDVNNWEKIKQAREIGFDAGVLPRDKMVYSVGSVAKHFLQFIGDKQPYEKSTENFLLRHPYGYHECKPGVYPSRGERVRTPAPKDLFDTQIPRYNPTYKPGAIMYDVSGYYYAMFRRLETLRLSVSPDGHLTKFPMKPSERSRLRDMLDAVGDCKPLRNSIAGVCAGSLKPGTAYTSSRPNKQRDPQGWERWKPGDVRTINPPGKPGPFRAAGLLLVATGAELCYLEALTVDAIYATIDSVASADKKPSIWKGYGFDVRLAGAGSAEFCHRGSYKIGPKVTLNYSEQGNREYHPVPRADVPQVFAKQWL